MNDFSDIHFSREEAEISLSELNEINQNNNCHGLVLDK